MVQQPKIKQPISQTTVDHIWQSGFCKQTVEQARLTCEDEVQLRLRFLQQHIVTCSDCRNAMIMKNIEAELAEAGFDPASDADTFRAALMDNITTKLENNEISPAFLAWAAGMQGRVKQVYDYEKENGAI